MVIPYRLVQVKSLATSYSRWSIFFWFWSVRIDNLRWQWSCHGPHQSLLSRPSLPLKSRRCSALNIVLAKCKKVLALSLRIPSYGEFGLLNASAFLVESPGIPSSATSKLSKFSALRVTTVLPLNFSEVDHHVKGTTIRFHPISNISPLGPFLRAAPSTT
jgi:hypothetical protein